MKNKYFFELVVVILFSLTFGFTQAQNKQVENTIVFGKTYTKEDLMKMNGVIRCATTEYEEYLQKQDPNRMTEAEFEAWINPLIEKAKAQKSTSGGIVTIPVVVHVIHSGQPIGVAPNIPDAQVQSQITVMNQDFRKMAGTPGYNTNPVGADTMIQFALAKVDPNGNPTNGIDRVNMCVYDWSTTDINNIVKPATIWDPTQYMNMWSIRFSDSSLLGYAQFPSGSGLQGLNTSGGAANTDGVVANYTTFGSIDYNDGTFLLGSANNPYNRGRTMTHEVGHFLGLRHIWGDGNTTTFCETDYCEDTPPAHQANYTCNPNIASCTAGLFEMVQNYMDYTNDTCMNIFTNDQKTRITTVMNNSPRRMELKTSTKDIAIPLFPNDAELKPESSCTNIQSACVAPPLKVRLTNRGTSTLTSAVITYSVAGGAVQTYTWTGSLAQHGAVVVDLPLPATTGSGTFTATVTTANGSADQRATNNTATGAYTAPAAAVNYAYTQVAFELQPDAYGSETTWTLKNSAGTTLYSGGPYTNGSATNLPPLVTQTWDLPNGDCYTFTVNDLYGDGFCCSYGNGYYTIKSMDGSVTIASGGSFSTQDKASFKLNWLATSEVKADGVNIYPNPATDVLNVTKVSDKAKFEVYNAVGQIVMSGNIRNNKVDVSKLVKGTYIITVSDKEISAKLKFIKK